MSDLFVEHEVLLDSAVKVGAVSRDIAAERRLLGRRAQALLASGWTGPAASGFSTAFAEWDEGAQEVLAALEDMGRLIAVADAQFAATDAARSAAIGAAGAALGSSTASGSWPSGLNL